MMKRQALYEKRQMRHDLLTTELKTHYIHCLHLKKVGAKGDNSNFAEIEL
jgi:hypothetical protein